MVRGRQDPRVSSKYKKARLVVLARDGYTCHYCGHTGDDMTVDHIQSIKSGGDPVSLENMVACCKRCNSSKGSRSQGVFLDNKRTPPVFSAFLSPTQSKIHEDSPFTAKPVGN